MATVTLAQLRSGPTGYGQQSEHSLGSFLADDPFPLPVVVSPPAGALGEGMGSTGVGSSSGA
jgi:hypothetical protein